MNLPIGLTVSRIVLVPLLIVFLISSIGMGLGSYAGGLIHDAVGTYEWLFLGSLAVASMAVVLGMSLRPPAAITATAPARSLAV